MPTAVGVETEAIRYYMDCRNWSESELARRVGQILGKGEYDDSFRGQLCRLLKSATPTPRDLGNMAAIAAALELPIGAIVRGVADDAVVVVDQTPSRRWQWAINNGNAANYFLTITRVMEEYLLPIELSASATQRHVRDRYYPSWSDDTIKGMDATCWNYVTHARQHSSYHHVIVASDCIFSECGELDWIDTTIQEIRRWRDALTLVLLPANLFEVLHAFVSEVVPFPNWSKIRMFDQRVVTVCIGMSGVHYFRHDTVDRLQRAITMNLLKKYNNIPLTKDESRSIGTDWNARSIAMLESIINKKRGKKAHS